MCKWGTTTPVEVLILAELSHTGEERLAVKPIDSCIAGIVDALVKVGIYTNTSCCGHGKTQGKIDLQDGRTLYITSKPTPLQPTPLSKEEQEWVEEQE